MRHAPTAIHCFESKSMYQQCNTMKSVDPLSLQVLSGLSIGAQIAPVWSHPGKTGKGTR